jgi:thimet oligopeptidase
MRKISTTPIGKTSMFIRVLLLCTMPLVAGSVKNSPSYLYKVEKRSDIIAILPLTKEQIEARLEFSKCRLSSDIEALCQIPEDQLSAHLVVSLWDETEGLYQNDIGIFESISQVHSKEEVRLSASLAASCLKGHFANLVNSHPKLYEIVVAAEKNQEGKSSISELKLKFRRFGLSLPEERRKRVSDLEQELANLSMAFNRNIANDTSHIWVTYQDLYGLPSDFIAGLEKRNDRYKLTCDYPVYNAVMQQCKSSQVRKRLYETFQNRAYPNNEAVLEAMIYKRDELAKELGYYSFAEYVLSQEMIKSELSAEGFIDEICLKCSPLAEKEFKKLIKDLPEGVYLTEDGRLNAYDFLYVCNHYKKKHFHLDSTKLAEYFPIEKTLEGLIHIYESFFNLEIKKFSIKGLWDPSVEVLEIKSKSSQNLLGYILLDLYPREGKYSHVCCSLMIPPHIEKNGQRSSGMNLVIANFPKPSKDKPALLSLVDVTSFFHEFGHAIHDLFSATDMLITSGVRNVKYDFVEMPSQLLEEWIYDSKILKMVSSHYLTKDPLPDEMISNICKAKDFNAGLFYMNQCMLAKLSLEFFKEGAKKNTNMIEHKIRQRFAPFFAYPDNLHFHFSFGHLDEYGPRYYGYMWADVFAADIFEQIKKEGLLSPKAGEKYVLSIIGKGSSEDPNLMLEHYLKRRPSMEPFLRRLGGDL